MTASIGRYRSIPVINNILVSCSTTCQEGKPPAEFACCYTDGNNLTSLACCALTGSLNWSSAWNWLFLVKVIIFMTVPNLLKICQKTTVENGVVRYHHWTQNCNVDQWWRVSVAEDQRLPAAERPGSRGKTCCRWWSSARGSAVVPGRELRGQTTVSFHPERLTQPAAQPAPSGGEKRGCTEHS